MTAIEITKGRPASGGYNGRVSSEWFSRPGDEKLLSLSDLCASVKGRAERSRIRTVESAAIGHQAGRPRRHGQEALAGRARRPGSQAGGGARTRRRARLARLPSSRHALHRGLGLPDLRKGDDSPLWTPIAGKTQSLWLSRRLPTARRRRSGPSVTSPTRSQR